MGKKKKQFKYFLKASKKDKRANFLNYGWHLTLRDTEAELPASHYPFTHIDIYIKPEHADEVLEEVNDTYFDDEEDCSAEDVSIFTNDYSADGCHNVSVGMRDDSQIAEFILDNDYGVLSLYDPEEVKYLSEHGLALSESGAYSSIGNLVKEEEVPEGEACMKVTDKPGMCFVPFKRLEISAEDFLSWLDSQDRFVILDDEGDYSEVEACCDFIRSLR